MAAVTCLRYTDLKQVKKEKQHNNENERDKCTHSKGGWVKKSPFAKQSRKKERDKGHDMYEPNSVYTPWS